MFALLGTFALAANAQDDGGGGPPGGGGPTGGPGGFGGHGRPPLPAIVRALDANHDGIIDSNELANATAVLKSLDKNGDGQLTRDEYLGARPNRPPQDGNGPGGGDTNAVSSDGPQGPPPGADRMGGGGHRHPPIPALVRALDVNNDGIIDSNEIANASAALKTLDKAGTGQLTRDEFMGPRPNRPPQDSGGNGNDAGGPPDGPPPGQ